MQFLESLTSSCLDPVVNLEVLRACQSVLGNTGPAANTFSTHSLSSVCLSFSLAHINTPQSLFLSLLSLHFSHLAVLLPVAWFLFGSSVLLAFVESKCCQLSSLSSRPPGYIVYLFCVHPQCPSCFCCLQSVFRSSLILTLIFSCSPCFCLCMVFPQTFIFSIVVPSQHLFKPYKDL